MAPPMGRHTTLDSEMRRAVDWLDHQPDIDKVVLGPFKVRSHSKTPGTLQVKELIGAGLKVVGYSGVGLRELMIYTRHREDLALRIAKHFNMPLPRGWAGPTVMQTAFEKAAENGRVGPPVVAPGVAGPPVVAKAPQKIPTLPPLPAAPPPAKPLQSVTDLGPQVSTAVQYLLMEISPETALEILTGRNPQNRKLTPGHVAKFIRILQEGEWDPEAGVIMFDTNGNLLNGQHRLTAIFESNKTVLVRVAVNVPEATKGYVDTVQKMRGDVDLAQLSGKRGVVGLHFHVLSRLLGRGVRRDQKWPLTPHQRQQFLEQHRAAIDFAISAVKTRKVITSSALAVVARAWYTIPAPKLEEFGRVLHSGFSEKPEHGPIIMLRNYLISQPARSADEVQVEIYQKTERALTAFLKGETITRLYRETDEQFPIPDEQAAS